MIKIGENKTPNLKKKDNRSNLVLIPCVLWSVVFCVVLKSLSFLPAKYIRIGILTVVGVNAILLLLSVVVNKKGLLGKVRIVVAAILLVIVFAGSVILPNVKGKMEKAFTTVPTEGELSINAYVLSDSGIEQVQELMGQSIGVQTSVDQEYQDYAIKLIRKECEGNEPDIVEYDGIYSLADALYLGEVDAILLNESYIDFLANNSDYIDIESKAVSIYSCIQKIQYEYEETSVSSITTEPFIVMVGGNDQYGLYNLKSSYLGRTDVNLMAVVNPVSKKILLVTIPRDSYLPFWGDTDKMDKLTHATVYGLDVWEDAINELLECKINYYVRVNFSSFIEIIDAIGGVTINNPYYFADVDDNQVIIGYEFPEGEITLSGSQALWYVRVRYYIREGESEAIGDEGRNKHQAIVLEALIKKVMSVSVITHIDDLMTAVEGTFVTDVSMDEIYALINMQLNDMANWDIETYSLSGDLVQDTSYAMGKGKGPIFNVCKLYEDTVTEAIIRIKNIMGE